MQSHDTDSQSLQLTLQLNAFISAFTKATKRYPTMQNIINKTAVTKIGCFIFGCFILFFL